MKQPKNKTIGGVANIVNTIVTELDQTYTAGLLNQYDDPSATLVGSMIESLYYLANTKNANMVNDAEVAVRNYEEELKTKSEHDIDPKLQGVRRHDNIALQEAIDMIEENGGNVHDRLVVAKNNHTSVKNLLEDMLDCYKAMFDREYVLLKDRPSASKSSKRPSRKMIA